MPTEKFDKDLNEAINGGSIGSKVMRYIILFGWIVAAGLFWIVGMNIINGQATLSEKVTNIQVTVGQFCTWKDRMETEHARLDRQIERLDERVRKSHGQDGKERK